jgi:hypothetical protein
MLEAPVRAGRQDEIAEILAELDRRDLVSAAKLRVSQAREARRQAIAEAVRATVEPATGTCIYKRWGGFSSSSKTCTNKAKSKFPSGPPYCGVHFRRVLDSAVLQATHNAPAPEPSEDDRFIEENTRIELTR